MNFAHPWLLPLVLLPLGWLVAAWRSSHRRLSLTLKALSLAAILLALAEPRVTLPQVKTGAVVLVDTSASIPAADRQRAAAIVRQIESHRGRNWLRVIAFDTRTRTVSDAQIASPQPAAPSAAGTDLENALISSMAAVPGNFLPRLLLVSDGNENQGSAVRAISQLDRLHVPVDTIALKGRSSSGLRLTSVSMPPQAFSAEKIPIDVNLDSSFAGPATLDVYGEGKLLASQPLTLEKGENTVRVHARIRTTGAAAVALSVKTKSGEEARFEQAVELRRAKVLYASQDPEGSDKNLLAAFNEADFDVSRNATLLAGDLSSFQLVVLNNLDLGAIPAEVKAHLASYVTDGGGLLLIGGERQVYKDDKKMDDLDRALPAKLASPETPQGNSVALIIDKSSSMEGRKIELARLSAIGVVDHLRPLDNIGVLIFDNSYQWAVPMRRADDKSLIKRLISGITPDGGTQIAPALAEAYRKVLPSKGTYKHIVLLTDGISEEGDSLELATEAAAHQVTISTVGLGQDVNRSYLERVANASGGRSYFLNEPVGLEQILLKDVQTYSGATAVEKPLTPIVAEKAEVLDGTGMETAPPLKGYARFEAKPGAETLLQIDEVKKDPLYVRWQYGLGRAAVFTSDAKSRWAEAWVNWPGFDKFWINVSRDLLTHAGRSQATAEFEPASGDVIVRYRIRSTAPEPAVIPALFMLGPGGFNQRVDVQRVAPHFYQGKIHLGQATGLFRIRPVNDSPDFPETGLYRDQPEFRDYGANDQLLREISSFTNGRFDPSPESVFDNGGRRMYAVWQLWPLCLAIAIALTIAELIVRKWSGITYRFRRA